MIYYYLANSEKLEWGLPVSRWLEREAVTPVFDWRESKLFIADSADLEKIAPQEIVQWKSEDKRLIVISRKDDDWNMLNMMAPYPVDCLIGANGQEIVRELSQALKALNKKEVWCVERFFAQPPKVEQLMIDSMGDLNEKIDVLINRFDYNGYFDSPKDYIKMMANELVTNALLDAARDENGEPIHLYRDRSEITDDERFVPVRVQLAVNQQLIALLVEDSFGALTRQDLLKNIERSIRERTYADKEGGAGLGLYMIFNCTNRLVTYVKKGQRTQIVCIIEKAKRYKTYKKRVTSIHFYEEEA